MNRTSWLKLPPQVALSLFLPMLCCVLACNAAPDELPEKLTNDSQTPDMTAVGQSLAFGGHEYLFVTTPRNWYDARSLCMNQGYYLVSVDSSAEEIFLHEQEARIGLQSWWLGYNDIAHEGSWVWEGPNSISPYTNWASGEPNNAVYPGEDEDCGIDGWVGSQWGQWNDITCSSGAPFICEKNLAYQSQGSFSYSISNTSNATVNTSDQSGYLSAGRILTVGTCGLEGASGSGDTYLRLFNAAGQEIASNDDAGGACKSLSNFSIVVPSSGKYTIRAGCFSSSSCSGTVVFTY